MEQHVIDSSIIHELLEDEFLCLPDECIIKILKFTDIRSRENVSLVCQRFYELVCDLERNLKPLKLSYSDVSVSLRNIHF